MRLSIIVTVYNKEQFIDKCLKSCINQVLVEPDLYEVLVINDGSTDNSKAIIEKNLTNKNIRLVSQENRGLSVARNNGVQEAKGDYVWFVDADDSIAPEAVSLICEASIENPDIIPIYAKTQNENHVRNAVDVESKTGKEILLGGRWEQCGVFTVFKRSFLLDNDLRFMPNIYHEDAEFTPRMLYSAKSVKVVPSVLYTVYRDPESITQVPRAKRAFDYLTVAESLSKYVINVNEERSKVGRVIDNSASLCINNAFHIICQNNKEEQVLLNKSFFEKRTSLIRVLKYASLFKYKVEALLFSFVPHHYVGIYKILSFFIGKSIKPKKA